MAAGATAAILVAGVAFGVVGMARLVDPPSPTTTVTGADGEQVVLDWRDYPADPSVDPDDVLAAPRAEDVVDVGSAELAAMRRAFEPVAPGLAWSTPDAPDVLVTDVGGNGYGGASLHQVYNSQSVEGVGLDADADWHALGAAVDAELAALGYGPIAWDFDREPYPYETQEQRDEQMVAEFGSLDPDEMWQWSGMAERDSMWVWVTIWDERRPTTPDGAWPESESGVSLFVGGTVVSHDDEQAYVDGVARFDGLMRPEATGSD
ncbi:hypothetical protein GCM10009846_25600 [Agrococcus versicolor]|uniref:Uncharacterized protein n=2 Tax=Agrococcus versicolor TaxID=501482 RepID=A0ABP5MR10_9MICO